ncbi:isoprenoid synthase domain-containing protein [Podospora fimiseda]|uniref:Isoprenoid synthase domain-containing protein n=1 Tax=Podospora fimiseda TaxID=252190 RepID=A0AAN7H016_9PEZI|nr:isoprenoid synthase domain-containing protein [Podospora fimiseda]
MSAFLEELASLFIGQGQDLEWTFNLAHIPSIDEYLDMVPKKTGGFMRMIVRLCLLVGPDSVADKFRATLEGFAETLGKFFQIRDDYMNLSSGEYSNQKGFAEDLDEGKFSYPLILASNTSGNKQVRHRLMGMLRVSRGESRSVEEKKYMIGLMEKVGAIKDTRKVLIEMEGEMEKMIERLEVESAIKNSLMRVKVVSLSVAGSGEGCRRG